MSVVLGAYVAGVITVPVVAGWGLYMLFRSLMVGPSARPRRWRRGR
jgi:hypothetical protein